MFKANRLRGCQLHRQVPQNYREFCASALKPLERVNKSIARYTTGRYRMASLAALEKETAILPAPLRLERGLLHRLAGYLAPPPTHGIAPLLRNAIGHSPNQAHRASALHFVERISAVRWPVDIPPKMLQRFRAQTRLIAAPVESEGGQLLGFMLRVCLHLPAEGK
jgi:hypothetical protein